MQEKNMIKQPLVLVGVTVVILLIASLLPQNIEVLGFKIRHVDIVSDLKENEDSFEEDYYDEYKSTDDYFNEESGSADSLDDGARLEFNQQSKINYAGVAALTYLNEAAENFIENEEDKIETYMSSQIPQTKKEKIAGNVEQLKYFFEALKKAKTEKIRVAHFGDSAIEGDLVTADIRENLQKKFGGNGVGFISITSQDIQFRQTTKHSFSDNWNEASLYGSNPDRLPLGISGEIFVPKTANAWVQYETTTSYPYLKSFNIARLLYSNARSYAINYSFDNEAKKSAKLESGNQIHELVLKTPRDAKKLNIEVPNKDQAYFYGTLLENGNGIYVDNFPLRGNTGVDLNHLSVDVLKEFNAMLNYKLIILQFGLNAAGSVKSNYSWYEREMINVITKLKEAFPNTSILMLSVHDKSMKRGTQFITDPSILKLLKTQIDIAKATDIAFWNLFEAMGGKDSMPNWVNSNPPMAFKDYIHFNDQGAKKVADLLSDALLEAYDKY